MHTVLLTGWTWFVGSHLLEELRKHHKVILLKRSTSNLEKIDHLLPDKHIKLVNADKINIEDLFKKNRIDIIIHLATSYGRDGKSDAEVLMSTTVLPMELLDLWVKYGTRAFINTNSYFNQGISLSDNIWLHAESKRDFQKYAKNKIEKSWGSMKLLDYMMWHVYGPRDGLHKLFPQIIRKMLQNEKKIDLVKGQNQRNFIYVKDVVNAYMCMLEYIRKMPNHYQEFYDRTGEVVTVRRMVELTKKFTNSTSEVIYGTIPDRANEIMTITPDEDTLLHQLWRKPQYTFEQWLLETIAYFRSIYGIDE